MTDAHPPRPAARPVVHEIHGVRRTDEFAWLAERGSPQVRAHLASERAWYEGATAHSRDLQAALYDEMALLVPPTDRSVSWREGASVYYTRSPRGRELEQFCRVDPATGEPQVLLDVTEEARGSSYAALGVREVSPDGHLLAWSVDRDGDELHELRVRDLRTGVDHPEVIARTTYTAAWAASSTAFMYVVPDAAFRPWQVWLHEVGTDPAHDVLVLQEDDERFGLEVAASRSGELLVLTARSRRTSQVWVVPADAPRTPPRPVAARREGIELAVDHAPPARGADAVAPEVGDHDLLVVTDDGWSEFRLMSAPSSGAGPWREALPPRDGERLVDLDVLAHHVVLTLRRDGAPLLRAHRRDGVHLDPVGVEIGPSHPAGTVRLGPEHRWDTTTVLVAEGSYTEPTHWSEVDLDTGARAPRHTQEVPGYDAARYVSERRWVTGRDGEPVPVTLCRRTDVPLDGTAPCLVYAYGAYEAVDEPTFDPALVPLLDRGVVFAHAHVRGGGEGGRRWWELGHLAHKQTTFDDLLAVADALADGVVDGRRIVTRGLSAGGLLQGAVLSQAPGRWRAVVAEVPFVDVLTSMLDPTIPLTVNEWEEWGDPRRPEDYAVMAAYSPYDNPPPAGTRPDLLVTGALHDPRVLVHEPAKWVARLRATDPAWAPRCLFRVELGEGAHTGPSGRFARLRYEAEILAWVLERVT